MYEKKYNDNHVLPGDLFARGNLDPTVTFTGLSELS